MIKNIILILVVCVFAIFGNLLFMNMVFIGIDYHAEEINLSNKTIDIVGELKDGTIPDVIEENMDPLGYAYFEVIN